MSEMDNEKPAADALEQDRDVVETDDETPPPLGGLPFDANEADAAEQGRAVGDDDEDDYR
ncbi:MAG TPA: hypothetical protein VN847_13545 [Streptosporangiaceae bacterium]|nr:hypothetical protein [Streptosporangiaceae bacterium]